MRAPLLLLLLRLALAMALAAADRSSAAAATPTPAPEPASCTDAACPVADADLEQVQVVFRHSYRGPFLWNPYLGNATFSGCQAQYPGFSLNISNEVDDSPGPFITDLCKPSLPGDGSCRESWLTPAGYQAAQDLGQYLRSTYVSDAATARLLGSRFDPESLWAHSTPYQRTTNTMRGVLTGLFPADAAAGANVTVWAVNSTFEYMYSSGSFCPPLKDLLKEQEELAVKKLARDPEMQGHAAEVMKAMRLPQVNFSRFAGDCGAPKANAEPCWVQAYDILATSLANNNPWPNGTSKRMYDLINARASQAYYHAFTPPTPEACLLPAANCTANLAYGGIGSLVWRLLGNMINAAAAGGAPGGPERPCGAVGFPHSSGCPSRPPPRLLLYAGHDNTQFGLLAVLAQKTPTTWPWYASHFEFELWRLRSTGARVVRIFYNGKAVRVQGAPVVMPLSQFQALVAQYVVPQQAHTDFCWPEAQGQAPQQAPVC